MVGFLGAANQGQQAGIHVEVVILRGCSTDSARENASHVTSSEARAHLLPLAKRIARQNEQWRQKYLDSKGMHVGAAWFCRREQRSRCHVILWLQLLDLGHIKAVEDSIIMRRKVSRLNITAS